MSLMNVHVLCFCCYYSFVWAFICDTTHYTLSAIKFWPLLNTQVLYSWHQYDVLLAFISGTTVLEVSAMQFIIAKYTHFVFLMPLQCVWQMWAFICDTTDSRVSKIFCHQLILFFYVLDTILMSFSSRLWHNSFWR